MREKTQIETDDEGLVRLQKLLAQSGVASRRKCEELMLAGLVEVDGEVVTRLGTKVDPRTARDPRQGPPAAADHRPRLPGAEQATRGRLHDVRPPRPTDARPTTSPTGPSGCSTWVASTPTPRG